jgi:hypothetical protein
MDAPLTGVVPVAPTIFRDDQAVDLGGTARVVDYLMDAGVDGLCLLANYSEQFSLTAPNATRSLTRSWSASRDGSPWSSPPAITAPGSPPRRAGHGRGDDNDHAALLRSHDHRSRARGDRRRCRSAC